jgi:hypothetical protein
MLFKQAEGIHNEADGKEDGEPTFCVRAVFLVPIFVQIH